MRDDSKADSDWPPVGDAEGNATPNGWRSSPAAVYGLEHPLRCPVCRAEIDQLFVVRLFPSRVSFLSSPPRTGPAPTAPLPRPPVQTGAPRGVGRAPPRALGPPHPRAP